MQIAYCPDCGKNTGHKRALGAGTILRTCLTGGLSLLAVPVYGKRCIIGGVTVKEALPLQSAASVGKETDRKWEEGREISVLEFKNMEYGRAKRVVAETLLADEIRAIGIRRQ